MAFFFWLWVVGGCVNFCVAMVRKKKEEGEVGDGGGVVIFFLGV